MQTAKDLSIIIADDDTDDSAFIHDALLNRDFCGDIIFVSDGDKLLQCLSKSIKVPNLILLDLNMPYKDGYQALSEIKGSASFGSIPVCIITSSLSPADKNKCYQLGCDAYYYKPTSIAEYDTMAGDILKFLQ